jgi:hypothetical protein
MVNASFPEELDEDKATRQANLREWMDVSEQVQADEGDMFGADLTGDAMRLSDEGLESDLLLDEQGMHIEELLPDGTFGPPTPLDDLTDEEILGPTLSEDAFVDSDILAGETTDDAAENMLNAAEPDDGDVDEEHADGADADADQLQNPT